MNEGKRSGRKEGKRRPQTGKGKRRGLEKENTYEKGGRRKKETENGWKQKEK